MSRLHLSLLSLLAAFGLALALPSSAPAYDYSYARVVRLSWVDGDVQVSRPGEQDQTWEQATINLPIQQGYSIATGQGRAEVEFESGATARLAENSILQFTELALSGGGRITKLTLTQGTATFYANLAREDSFVVITPSLQATIPQSARFRVDAAEEGSQVSVLKGDVEVDSRAGTNRLTKGHTLAFRTSNPDEIQIERNAKPDEWDHWVADRDEVVHTGTNAELRYVSSPYSYGLSDLYSYGSWYNLDGYGRCWRPYGVGFSWVPYWNGRWAFYPGLGWTWVSFEPWGWLPYHFGSWDFRPGFGWFWVPGFRGPWQPALVTWVRVGRHLGWVPRSPADATGQMRTPANLQHGFVTAASGQPGATAYQRVCVAPHDTAQAQVVQGPPTGFTPAATPAPTPAVHVNPSGSPRTGLSGSSGSGIVYDPRERRFVNHATAGATVKGNPIGDARKADTPVQGSSGTTTVTPQPHAQPAVPRGGAGNGTPPPPPPPRQTAPPAPSPPRVTPHSFSAPPAPHGGMGNATPLSPPPPARQATPPPTPMPHTEVHPAPPARSH